ncbi:UNVERIFIED_CONTAM: putative ABC transport system permease protein [Brevibacillus sp. OAP136]
MLLKLSLASMRKMMKDYLVLLIGLVISISIFYMFQTLAMNKAFIESNSVISAIQFVFYVGAFLLAFITFFYIFYANSFLLSLRRKELGMYMMLGAKKGKVSQLLFLETLAVGILSLVIGSIVGVGLSSGVGRLLMSQLEIAPEGYQPFYMPSLLVTAVFFLVLFLLTSTVNAIKLARTTELNLITAEQQNDRVKAKGPLTIVVAALGLMLTAVGYYVLIHIKELQLLGFVIATVTITIGTYLIFISLLPVFLNALKKNRSLTDKKLNAFTFAQLRFRVNNLTKVLGTVTMLIALGVGAMAGGLAFQKNVGMMAELSHAYDSTLIDPVDADYDALKTMNVEEQRTYHYKTDDKAVYYQKDELLAKPPLIINTGKEMYIENNEPTRVSAKLPADFYSMYEDKKAKQGEVLPKEWQKALSNEFSTSYKLYDGKAIRIVDQVAYAGVKGHEHTLLLTKADDFLKYKSALKEMDERQKALVTLETGEENPYLSTKYGNYEAIYVFTSGTMFMGFFLGIAFLAMMASCLMFKILSGATRDRNRYSMLRKIGVRKEWLVASIYKELFLLFIFPAIIGLVHVFVGMNLFSFILLDPYVSIWLPLTVFLLIYAVYYFITVRLYRGIVLPKEV